MYGLLVRGGIVKSTAYIGGNIIQGQGIIDAVSKEHDAVYPQIIIDSSIYTYVHTLHFLTCTELEYGASVQNKIDAGLELNSDEQKFLKDISEKYQKEKLALTWKDIILMRSNDEKPFLNYMYNIKVMNFYAEHNIPFSTIRDLLQHLNLENSFAIPKEEDAIKYIQKHREILIDRIKQYGDYADVNINDLGAVVEREKIIKKYVWLWGYHRSVCILYKLPEYDLSIKFSIDPRIMKMIVLLDIQGD